MQRLAVLNVVGLTPSLIGDSTPRIRRFAAAGRVAGIQTMLPAVTCSVQTTYLTGKTPGEHGIVANGWYVRDDSEIRFWRQSDALVQRPRIWDHARAVNADFTCANLFWWFAMHSSCDVTLTPRPMYPADGRKIPDIWAHPSDLRADIQRKLGAFPLFKFWGPATSIDSTRWIADAAAEVERRMSPTLSLVYLPHLDYVLQKRTPRPDDPDVVSSLREVDTVVGGLLDEYERRGVEAVLLSEYGIEPVDTPVHLNRLFRQAGWITIREELGRELLDAGASRVFAVADHQVAHVYVRDSDLLGPVRNLLESTPGVGQVLDASAQADAGLDHPRSGNLIAIASQGAWFTYYYWLDENRRPDFADTVDIHRKPGYDPAELVIDPAIRLPKLRIGSTLLRRKLGFRSLLRVIGTDASVVRGSHGRLASSPAGGPVFITRRPELLPGQTLRATDVHDALLAHLGLQRAER